MDQNQTWSLANQRKKTFFSQIVLILHPEETNQQINEKRGEVFNNLMFSADSWIHLKVDWTAFDPEAETEKASFSSSPGFLPAAPFLDLD